MKYTALIPAALALLAMTACRDDAAIAREAEYTFAREAALGAAQGAVAARLKDPTDWDLGSTQDRAVAWVEPVETGHLNLWRARMQIWKLDRGKRRDPWNYGIAEILITYDGHHAAPVEFRWMDRPERHFLSPKYR